MGAYELFVGLIAACLLEPGVGGQDLFGQRPLRFVGFLLHES
jgi:hypothetical protein